MNRRELARLGWRENSLAYLEKHLQGYKDPQAYQEQYQSIFFFASPLFQNMWFQEIKDLTETAAQDLLRGVMKILLMPFFWVGWLQIVRQDPTFGRHFHASCRSPLKGIP